MLGGKCVPTEFVQKVIPFILFFEYQVHVSWASQVLPVQEMGQSWVWEDCLAASSILAANYMDEGLSGLQST